VLSHVSEASATELREAVMALARQMRRHRPDTGLTLTQLEALGEISRAGPLSPADLAARMHVRAQSLTDGLNGLEARGLVSRRPDPCDRRRQLLEITADGTTLLEGDRAQRDEWLNAAIRAQLSELEADLLMLTAPILRRLADTEKGQSEPC
jgi:DNA-binding MarR family transcriptional regulator